MQLTLSKSQLLSVVQKVISAVGTKSNLPIMHCLKLEVTESGDFTVSATDMEVSLQAQVALAKFAPGSIGLRANTFAEIVRELPDCDVSLESIENQRVRISAGRALFHLVGVPASDFPKIPGLDQNSQILFARMNGPEVASMLDKTVYAVATETPQQYLLGLAIEIIHRPTGRFFRMVGSDGFRLAVADSSQLALDDAAWSLFDSGLIVPRKGMMELRKILTESHDDFFMTLLRNHLLIRQGSVRLSVRAIEGPYFNYGQFIPEPVAHPARVHRQELLAALRRVSLISVAPTEKLRWVRIIFDQNSLRLLGKSSELGDAEDVLDMEYSGPACEAYFNSRYLIDALHSIPSAQVLCEIHGNHNAILIREDSSSHQHVTVIMPIEV